VGFVLVALGLVALTAGPSIVEMSAIEFIAGIPAVVDTPQMVPGPIAGDIGVFAEIDEEGQPADPLFASAPPILPRRVSVPIRPALVSVLIVLIVLAALVGAPAPSGVRRRLAVLAVRGSTRSIALRRLRRRGPPFLLV
jgi:hypothetical protein